MVEHGTLSVLLLHHPRLSARARTCTWISRLEGEVTALCSSRIFMRAIGIKEMPAHHRLASCRRLAFRPALRLR